MKRTFKFGLIGHNISYSRSVDIFKAIFQIQQLDGICEVYDFAPGEFKEKFPKLFKSNIDGLSVTIPYKNKVIRFLNEIDPIAKALEAVNSILVNEGKLLGFNTDCYGFSLPLRKYGEKLKHGSALIFGAGGAAKAAVYSLYTDYEIKTFFIMGRNEEKLELFKKSLQKHIDNIKINTLTKDDYPNIQNERYEIIVNSTPMGGWNHPDETPLPSNFIWFPGKIYYDLNYNHENKIINEANEKSLIAIDGSAMLVGQALQSFYLWTGQNVAFEPVYQTVFSL